MFDLLDRYFPELLQLEASPMSFASAHKSEVAQLSSDLQMLDDFLAAFAQNEQEQQLRQQDQQQLQLQYQQHQQQQQVVPLFESTVAEALPFTTTTTTTTTPTTTSTNNTHVHAAAPLACPPARALARPRAVQHHEESEEYEISHDDTAEFDDEDEEEEDASALATSKRLIKPKRSSSNAPRIRKRMDDNDVRVKLSTKQEVRLSAPVLAMEKKAFLAAVSAMVRVPLNDEDKALLCEQHKRYLMRTASRRRREERANKEMGLRAELTRANAELDAVMKIVQTCSARYLSPTELPVFLSHARAAIGLSAGMEH